MITIGAFISIEDAVSALKYDYDRYIVSHMQYAKERRPMSIVFDSNTVMTALAKEIMATKDEDKAARAVVTSLIDQGVDIVYATKMAATGRNRLLTAIDHGIGGITFSQLEGGSIDICSNGDAFVRYNKE